MTCSQGLWGRTQSWEKPSARTSLSGRSICLKFCAIDSLFEECTELAIHRKLVSSNQLQRTWKLLFHRRISVTFVHIQSSQLECTGSAQQLFQICFIFHTAGTFPNATCHIQSGGFSFRSCWLSLFLCFCQHWTVQTVGLRYILPAGKIVMWLFACSHFCRYGLQNLTHLC